MSNNRSDINHQTFFCQTAWLAGGNMINIFIATHNTADKALKQCLSLLGKSVNFVEEAYLSDMIVVTRRQELYQYYSKNKYFSFIPLDSFLEHSKMPQTLPYNVRQFPVLEAVAGLFGYIAEIEKLPLKKIYIQTGTEYTPKDKTEQSIRVLIIDDLAENLELALTLLGKEHFITLASGYREGKELITRNNYDAVLSDCQMQADTQSALSTSAVKLGENVHNGFFLMFPATKKGARFAVVTDANHHQDWVSAIFDDLHEPQIVNGQYILFINYMDKRWDEALKKLMNL